MATNRNEYIREYAIANRDKWNYIQHKSRAKTFLQKRGELSDLLELQALLTARIHELKENGTRV